MPSRALAALMRPFGWRLPRWALALVCGALLLLTRVSVASAQPKEAFQGSEIRTAFEFGITASASAYGKLRILATREAVERFLAVKLPDSDRGANYQFSLTIEPVSSNPVRCDPLSDTPASLKLCLDASKPIRMGEWEVAQKPGFSREVMMTLAFRWTVDPTRFAKCALVNSTNELTGCTFTFEEKGLVHTVDAPPDALKHYGAFDCAALKLRNAIWPGAPELPSSCRNNP